jgi:hypothetical protein
VAECCLQEKHIPGLIALAARWGDESPDDDSIYGPIHAWRALGQLRAVDAVQGVTGVPRDAAPWFRRQCNTSVNTRVLFG